MMWNHLTEHFRLPDYRGVAVGGAERVGGRVEVEGADALGRVPAGDAACRSGGSRSRGTSSRSGVWLPHRQNTVHVSYRLVAGTGPIRLKLRPSVHFRGHDDPVSHLPKAPYVLTASEDRYELSGAGPVAAAAVLRPRRRGGPHSRRRARSPDVLYRVEENRGYEAVGALWSPGLLPGRPAADGEVTLIASTDPWERFTALPPPTPRAAEVDRRRRLIAAADPAARAGFGAELVLAADQFLIIPAGRVEDAARAHAAGDEAADRDRRLPLVHRLGPRHHDQPGGADPGDRPARRGRLHPPHVRPPHPRRADPQLLPRRRERGASTTPPTRRCGSSTPSTATATSPATGSRSGSLLPGAQDIVDHHLRGTRFGIGVDPADGLLRQGAEGYQLTWMDAKVGDWVVTPRRGKAVEINALWYNALRLLEGWLREDRATRAADRPRRPPTGRTTSFNRRFWNAEGGLPVRRGRRRERATTRPAGPTRCSPSRSTTRCWTATAGSRCSRWCGRSC